MQLYVDRRLALALLLAVAAISGCSASQTTVRQDEAGPPDASVFVEASVEAEAALPEPDASSDALNEAEADALLDDGPQEDGASTPCLGDEYPAGFLKAGTDQPGMCNDLANAEGCTAQTTCIRYADITRAGVFAQLYNCLKKAPHPAERTERCNATHAPAVELCVQTALAAACAPVAPSDGGRTCDDVSGNCTPRDDPENNAVGIGVSMQQCERVIAPLNSDGVAAVLNCFMRRAYQVVCEQAFAECAANASFWPVGWEGGPQITDAGLEAAHGDAQTSDR